MNLNDKQIKIWKVLAEEFPDTDIPIEGSVNLKARPISDYKVKISYGELTLIIAMIRDYTKELDKRYEDGSIGINALEYQSYYRPKFMNMAERISKQINYNYEEKLEKCLKKMEKQNGSDVGEDALTLAAKRK